MKKAIFMIVGMLTLIACCNRVTEASENASEQIETLKQIVALQDRLIERAQDELEYHMGDYAFCDGDEPMMIDELKGKLSK